MLLRTWIGLCFVADTTAAHAQRRWEMIVDQPLRLGLLAFLGGVTWLLFMIDRAIDSRKTPRAPSWLEWLLSWGGTPHRAPRSREEPTRRPRKGQRSVAPDERAYAWLLAVSIIMVLAAMVSAWRIGMEANVLDNQLYHATVNLRGLKHNVEYVEARLR